MSYLEPYSPETPLNGHDSPGAVQIEELIKLLVTIHHRYGNTAIKYRLSWGANALWVEDEQKQKIEKLEASVKRLKKKLAKVEK